MPDVTNPTKHDISPALGRWEKTIRSRPALDTQQLQDQPGLHEISLEKKNHTKQGRKKGQLDGQVQNGNGAQEPPPKKGKVVV